MGTVGDLSGSAADTIYAVDLLTRMLTLHKSLAIAHNPLTVHFVDYIVAYIKQRYGDVALYEGGLTITTTLDLSTQAMADKSVESGVRTYANSGGNPGSLLVNKPSEG